MSTRTRYTQGRQYPVTQEQPSTQSVERRDGSGTGRYGSGDHWTQHGDGTDYPSEGGSFGVPQNAQNAPAEPLKPFVPFTDPVSMAVAPAPLETIVKGSSFRIMRADQSVDPVVHVATEVEFGLVSYESDGETLEVSRDHVVSVKAEASNG